MGNLLGDPGAFYAHLTGETSQHGARLGRLVRGARKALRSFRPAADDDGRIRLNQIEADLPRIRGLMEGGSYRPAIEALGTHIRDLVRVVIGRECPDEVAIDFAFGRDVKLGLGFWFALEVKRRMGATDDAELLHIDALLTLYFLSVYRLPPPGRPM